MKQGIGTRIRIEFKTTITMEPQISDFTIVKPISKGSFGKVFLCHKNGIPETPYAIKAIKKRDIVRKNMRSNVLKERKAFCMAGEYPFCVKLFYSLQTHNYIYLVMEWCIGGDLKSLVQQLQFFPLHLAAFYTAEIALAIEYLHSIGIVHRDIKPDNLLLDNRGHVKLTDFGLSRVDDLNRPNDATNFTPGQLASLECNFTYSHIQDSSSSISTSSTKKVVSSMTSTPVGWASGTSSRRVQKYRRRRTRRKKRESNPKASTINSPPIKEPALNVSDQWSIISTPSEPQGKRVKLDPNESSYINISLEVSPISSIESGLSSNSSRPSSLLHSSPLESLSSSAKTPEIQDMRLLTFPNATDTSPVESIVAEKENVFYSPNPSDLSSMSNIACDTSGLDSGSELASLVTSSAIHTHTKGHNEKFESHQDPQNTSTDTTERHGMLSPEIGRRDFGGYHHHHHNFTGIQREAILSPQNGKNINVYRSKRNVEGFERPQLAEESKANLSFRKRKRDFSFDSNQNEVNSMGSGQTAHTGLSMDMGRLKFKDISALNDISESEMECSVISPDEPGAKTEFRSSLCSIEEEDVVSSDKRILGTPDYLAPELIRQTGHGPAVDWWSLGICLYEFLIGILPFSDVTAEKVFSNVLNCELEFPEGMNPVAQKCIENLLVVDPSKRIKLEELSGSEYEEIFQGISWNNLYEQEAPFIPKPDSPYDTVYYAERNKQMNIEVSDIITP